MDVKLVEAHKIHVVKQLIQSRREIVVVPPDGQMQVPEELVEVNPHLPIGRQRSEVCRHKPTLTSSDRTPQIQVLCANREGRCGTQLGLVKKESLVLCCSAEDTGIDVKRTIGRGTAEQTHIGTLASIVRASAPNLGQAGRGRETWSRPVGVSRWRGTMWSSLRHRALPRR